MTKLKEARAKWNAKFSKTNLANGEKELLPNNTYAVKIVDKVVGYSLNDQHDRGKHKAAVLKASLGYTSNDAHLLSQAVK